jgi:hypothetical protein
VKSFDAFLITLAMVLVAATARIISPHLPGNRQEDGPGSRWTPR